MENIKQLQSILDSSNKIVFFSGAGMSTASGIPDFRSANGLYKKIYRAEEMLSHSFFENHTKDFYEFYKDKMIYKDALPNDAHKFIAKLETKKEVIVVTQNIDGLHQLAGSKNVYELHGSIHRNYCTKCHTFYPLDKILESDIPYCHCGGLIKPDVILYEEGLDQKVIEGAVNAIAKADALIVCGTSLNVYPAASFIRYYKGSKLVIINRDETSYDQYCDLVIHDDLVKILKALSI